MYRPHSPSSKVNWININMSLKIAFYRAKYGTLSDKLFALSSWSKYSHCEIVFPDGMCASSSPRDGGVRLKNIRLGRKWDVFALNSHPPTETIRYWFNINDGLPYDRIADIGAILNLNVGSFDKMPGAYMTALCLGVDPIVTPGRLFRKLVKLGMING
jgi:hypothetical protein